jgi:hypothetical protein
VALDLYCWDYENDGFVIDGGGPGEDLDGPMSVPGGDGGGAQVPVWHYRTATAGGQEATTVCLRRRLLRRRPRPADGPTRRGARPRRTDDVRARRAGGPRVGQRALGRRRIPPGRQLRRRRSFSVVAAAHGRTSETKLAIENADEPRWFSGLGCSPETAKTTAGAPGVIRFSCADDDGDALEATVTKAPEHGALAPPLLSPARYGWDDVAIAWSPQPGFVGIDEAGLRVTDGHGVQVDLSVDLYVYPAAAAQPAAPALPATGEPSVGQAPAVSPADQARVALGTRDVALVRRLGDARVFARRAAVRGGLAPRAGSTALAVTCPLTCQLVTQARAARGSARLARTSAGPGRAARLRLSRRAAGLLRASGSSAFSLSAGMPAGRAGHGTVRLRRR